VFTLNGRKKGACTNTRKSSIDETQIEA